MIGDTGKQPPNANNSGNSGALPPGASLTPKQTGEVVRPAPGSSNQTQYPSTKK